MHAFVAHPRKVYIRKFFFSEKRGKLELETTVPSAR
jgi:hypothetical protein